MNPVVTHIKWIMLVSGALTCTMVMAVIAPEAALQSNFGEMLQGPGATIVVRNWGALITLMGLLLIYGAFRPAARVVALVVAGASKLVFVALVLAHGNRFLGHQVGIAVLIDAVWVVLFAWYLLSTNSARAPN
jgi:hypothetical protein